MKENLKIKNTLKKLYENQEFESSFEDEVTSWDDNETIYEEYVFRYFMEVGKVLGEGDRTVASINVIITDIQKDGDDFYYDWAENGDYREWIWYCPSIGVGGYNLPIFLQIFLRLILREVLGVP